MSLFQRAHPHMNSGETVETAWCNAWSSLGVHQDCTVDSTDEFVRIYTPAVPDMLMNAILRTRNNGPITQSYIANILAPFRAHHLPYQWWVRLGAEPHELRMLLAEAGMVVWSTFPGMLLSLQHPIDTVPSPDITIQVATSRANLDLAHQIICQVFNISSDPMRRWVGNNPHFTIYLAFWRGIPAGAMACQIQDGIAGVFHVAALPHIRHKGVASAMMSAAIANSQSIGATHMALTASPDAEHMYRRMGFIQVCNFEFWMPGPKLMTML